MSTTLMTRHERIANAQRLGYAEPKAEFLAPVALHGGYFVRRQFDAWIGVERGKRSEDFLAELLDRDHCRRHVFAHNRQVFHLRFRPLHRAVGDEHSRNGRERQPQAIKAGLMALDFVLAHLENLYFATEREKVAHACDELGTDHGALPVKVFRSPDGASSTRRYFLDCLPLFTRPGATELAFCYIESGFETGGPFAANLRRYVPLFGELPSFELVSVTTASTRLGQTQTVFERVLSRGRKWLTKVTDPERLLADFRDRQLFERRETSSFDRLRLDALRDDMDRFSGPHFAEMFLRWKVSGDEVIRAEIAAQKMPNGRFSCCILPHDCDIFDRAEEASLNAWIYVDLVNAAKKARSPQFRWRRSPKAAFGVPPHGPSAPHRGGSTPVSGSGEGRERPRFRSAAPPRHLPPSPSRRRGSLPPLPFQEPMHFVMRIALPIDR